MKWVLVWPALAIPALMALAAAAVHFWWKRAFLRANEESRREIERLKAAQRQAALQVETQQAALFNSMIEGLLLLDANGRIQLANRAFIRLFDIAADVRGKTLVETLRLTELVELVKSVSPDRQVLGYELRLGGLSERWLQINAAAMCGTGGERLGTILVFHDLTRIKQLERTRQEFVANVSHELRTPLSLIKGYVETLLDGAIDNPDVRTKFLQTIQRNSERLQFLIEDLLTISELESGRIRMNLQNVALRQLADKVLGDLGARARSKQVTLANELPDVMVRADAERLQQVLGNLVDNAIKYGRNEGSVTLTGRPSNGDAFEVCVSDDGPGIPADALERVFERFFRVDKARSREQGGTGLGLSIVKHIVQSHGGKVWARSELNQGAAFFFTLPSASPPAAASPPAEPPDPREHATAKRPLTL
jgi:two-component system phosphate regulon sensor histidine kinase PhoR